MRPRSGIALEGYFGEGNAGDDAFCVVAAEMLARPDTSLRVLGRPRLAPQCDKSVRFVLPEDGRIRAPLASWKIRSGDVVHFGGSTLRRMNVRRADEMLLARVGLVRQHAAGVSIGPFRNSVDERDIGTFLRRFRRISTRDQASWRRLQGLELDVDQISGFDPAVLLPDVLDMPPAGPNGRRLPTGTRPVLGVSIRPFESIEGIDSEVETRRNANLVEALQPLARAGVTIRLLSLNRHPKKGDASLSRWVVAELGDDVAECVEYEGDLSALLCAIGTCDAVVAMRLHAAVFAFSMGVPFGIVGYHPKCAEFGIDVGLRGEDLWSTDASELRGGRILEDLLKGPRSHDLGLTDAVTRAQAGINYVVGPLAA